jgi:hypothetical protein
MDFNTKKEIGFAYRTKSLTCHPDKVGSDDAQAGMLFPFDIYRYSHNSFYSSYSILLTLVLINLPFHYNYLILHPTSY